MSKDNKRFVLFPIKYPEIWESYQSQLALFWTASELDLTSDLSDWNNKLNDNEKLFISHVLAFFSSSDGIISENLAMRFYNDTDIPELKIGYIWQAAMEGVHAESYSLLIDTYISNSEEKEKLFNAISTVPIVKEKAEWALRWIDSNDSFAERLVAFAAVEGLLFSSSFASIYWIKKRGLMPGLCFSNELISRDEGLHTDLACIVYKTMKFDLPKEKIYSIIKEAVELECKFATVALPVDLIGMNSKLMSQYIRFVADRLSQSLGYDKIYNEINPFDFMEMISLNGKSNFFEKRVADYSRATVGKTDEENSIKFDVDF